MMTKTTNDCTTKGRCYYESLTRTRFFHGMLLTDDHLRAEQTYHREALKRVNRYLLGWGIVCGLEVKHTSGLCIKVHPGLALDCYGNVIEVCKCITIDLSEECKKAYPGACVPAYAEPICKYLVLRYVEIQADSEPVLTASDDCTPPGEGTKCEASKYREGFCIELWDKCPEPEPCPDDEDGPIAAYLQVREMSKGKDAKEQTEYGTEQMQYRMEQMQYRQPDCMKLSPPCSKCDCGESAVGLAKLTIDCDKNEVTVSCDCRHYVWSPRMLRWLMCSFFAKCNEMPKRMVGLDEYSGDLPSADLIASRPPEAAWQAAMEYAAMGDQFKALQTRVDYLEKQMTGLARPQASKPKPKEP